MKTKTSLIILAIIAAIAAVVLYVAKPKANMPAPQDGSNAPVTQTENNQAPALGTEGQVIVEPTTPANPEFPVSGVNPNE